MGVGMNTHTTCIALVLVVAAAIAPATTAQDDDRRFVVANDSIVKATLIRTLNTRDVRDGEPFTARVTVPSELLGATLHGRVVDAKRSGRLTGNAEMTLEFEQITLPDGRSYRFAGTVEGVQLLAGPKVEVDDEGEVSRRDSQTRRTAWRTAIGAIAGAVIGGSVGGADAAATGAAIGAGTGAGSVAVQGRRDLILPAGTGLVIRARAIIQ